MSAAATMPLVVDPDVALAAELAQFYDDPLGFVMFAYPWGVPGTLLENETGPDDNQKEFLNSIGMEVRERGFDGMNPVMPIRMSETSGHGTGKSAQGAWITDWILSTRPHSIGTVTAGTFTQLMDRTWAAIRYWTKLCVTAHWFEIQARSIHHKNYPESWAVRAQTCKEQNAQSFAGQHARTSTSWYLFDEASEVPDKIWETAEGGLTDGEPMIFAWGQPVRNSGEFYVINFGKKEVRWNTRRVDSRTSRFTSQELIKQWLTDWGPDSDFCKVRIFGQPPSASELQYIDRARIEAARKRRAAVLGDEPLVAGFDVSGGGTAWNVIRFRRGLDGNPTDASGQPILPIRIPGEHDPERSQRVGICAELLKDRRPGRQLAAIFIDAAFGAPIAVRLKGLGFDNVYEVNFGGASPDAHFLNMRAYMYGKAKEWLLLGSLPDDDLLCDQLAVPGYHINNSGKLVIESKESIIGRGEKSPDDADSFVLTWALSVAPPKKSSRPAGPKRHSAWG